jgi:hypothetical protein
MEQILIKKAEIMSAASIPLPARLREKLQQRAEEKDSLPEEVGIELLEKGLDAELDPAELVEHYQVLSERYHSEARELLNRGDLVQASEKFWGASALAVKRIVATRGLKLEKHGAVWAFVSRLARERNDNELILLLHAAQGLHRNFYENELDRKAVEITAERVELLLEKLSEI